MKRPYSFSFSDDINENIIYMSKFFGIEKVEVFTKALELLLAYLEFKKENPDGKLIFRSKDTEQEILVIHKKD